MDCGVKLILCLVHLSEKLENRGSLLLRIYPVCLGLPGHAELMQELRVSHCAGDGGGCGSFVSMNALTVWCLCSDSISHFCRVLQVGLDPWLSWHCCVLSAGLKDGMILLYRSSKTPENFSYVEKKQIWLRFFSPLLHSNTNGLSRALRGEIPLPAVGRGKPACPAWPCSAGPQGHPAVPLPWHCCHCSSLNWPSTVPGRRVFFGSGFLCFWKLLFTPKSSGNQICWKGLSTQYTHCLFVENCSLHYLYKIFQGILVWFSESCH